MSKNAKRQLKEIQARQRKKAAEEFQHNLEVARARLYEACDGMVRMPLTGLQLRLVSYIKDNIDEIAERMGLFGKEEIL